MTATIPAHPAPADPIGDEPPDPAEVKRFAGHVLGQLIGAASTGMIMLGDRLGPYRAMAGRPDLTAAELATAAGCHERYVREWLAQQAAAGVLVTMDGQRFTLPPERAVVLARDDSRAAPTGSSAPALRPPWSNIGCPRRPTPTAA